MAKSTRSLSCWIEVAPALLISHLRTSNAPKLETIIEVATEEYEEDL